MKTNILLIEDNPSIATQIYDFLESAGFILDYAATGYQGLNLAMNNHYEVIILDLMLPDISGIEVCRQIKTQCELAPPVLMLTARDTLYDKREGFVSGADDYMTKPFELLELQLRCQALSRRQSRHQTSELRIGELVINSKTRQAYRQGQALELSGTDFTILLLLASAYPAAVSRQEIINKVWGDDLPDSDVLRSHIYTLRRSLDKPFQQSMLKTIHGIGFRLEASYEND